jgi:hypothetical protein
MAVLNLRILFISLIVGPSYVFGYAQEDISPERLRAIEEQSHALCSPVDEYKQALRFMRETKVIVITETASRRIADLVSRGCNGSAGRFEKTLVTMKAIGLSDKKSLELALEFSRREPEVQRNFLVIFNRAFLSEFFDYDYTTAVRLAYELSKDYKGDPQTVRDDFIELSHFCKEGNRLDLPLRICAELAVKIAKLSQYYPHGVRQPFQDLYQAMREKKEFQLDMKTALDMTYNILKSGPNAAKNFFEAFEYAMDEKGLGLVKDEALHFAVRMAGRSYRGSAPPLIPGMAADTEREISNASLVAQ